MPNRLWTLLLTLSLSGGATSATGRPCAGETEADAEIAAGETAEGGEFLTADRRKSPPTLAPAPASDVQLWGSYDPGLGAGWTARLDGDMVGELNLLEIAPHHGLVDALWAGGPEEERVTAELLRAAVEHAHTFGLLKLTFETRLPAELTLDHLDGHGVRFSRLRPTRHGDALDFYVDLHRPLNASDRPRHVLRPAW